MVALELLEFLAARELLKADMAIVRLGASLKPDLCPDALDCSFA